MFITIQKFKFKFRIFRVLAHTLWACLFFSSYQPNASNAARGLPHTKVVTLFHLFKFHDTHHKAPLRPGVCILQMDLHGMRPTSPGHRKLGQEFWSSRWPGGGRVGSG